MLDADVKARPVPAGPAPGIAGQGRTIRVLILAGDADGNVGDQAIRTATCALIRAFAPSAQVTIVTRHAAQVERTLGVCAIAAGARGWARQLVALRQSDLVLVGGGGLFQDDDSLVKMPYWCARILAARTAGTQVAGFALGVGPLDHPASRLAARLVFRAMCHVSVRDRHAHELAQLLCDRPVHLLPDPAICLEPAGPDQARACLASAGLGDDGRPLLGVSVRRWFPPAPRLLPRKLARRLGIPDPQDGPDGQRMVQRLADLLDRQVERFGLRVLFFPTYCSASEADDQLARTVVARMRHGADATVVRIDDAALLKACAGRCRAFLGGRMHPLILAAGMGVPLVGLSYNPKFTGFAELIGMGDRIVDVRSFVHGDGLERLDHLLDEALREGPVDPAPVDRCRAMVEDGVRRLFAGL